MHKYRKNTNKKIKQTIGKQHKKTYIKFQIQIIESKKHVDKILYDLIPQF